MFFQYLIIAILSYDDQCVAEFTTPKALEGKQLRFLQLMIRHGARAPLTAFLPSNSRGYWLCDSEEAIAPRMHAAPVNQYRRFKQVFDQRLVDYQPNCRTGDLLLSGMDQHEKLGKLYHDYLFGEHRLFTSLPVDPNETYFRCTDIERTLRSAEGFIHGVFPPQSPNEIIDIETDTSDMSILRPSATFCKDLSDMRNEYIQTDAYKKWIDNTWEIISELAHSFNIEEKSGENINKVCDFVSTVYCDDKRLPHLANNETIINACLNSIGFYLYDFYQSNSSVAGSYTMRKMISLADRHVNENGKLKFSLLSAHDSSISTILIYLIGKNMRSYNRIPPYASHLAMELWSSDDAPEDFYIRFALNGKDLPLEKMENQTFVKYTEFKETYSDYTKYCTEVPSY